MIQAKQLLKQMGKKKFVNFVLNNKDREKTGAERAHARRWGTNVRYRRCEHGIWIIDNYEPKFCEKCFDVVSTAPGIVCHSHEYFNIGTGTYGTTTEHRKAAKSMGLVEAG